jgi:hypothetical protein
VGSARRVEVSATGFVAHRFASDEDDPAAHPGYDPLRPDAVRATETRGSASAGARSNSSVDDSSSGPHANVIAKGARMRGLGNFIALGCRTSDRCDFQGLTSTLPPAPYVLP